MPVGDRTKMMEWEDPELLYRHTKTTAADGPSFIAPYG